MTIEYLSESTEVAAKLAEAEDAIAVLPQPFVTTAMMQNENLRIALSLTDEWDKLQGEGGSTLVTGVTIVRNEVLEENPQAFAEFLKEYEASIEYTETNPEEAAALIAGYEIVPKEPVALQALPYCNIRFIQGSEMQEKVSGYLEVLYDAGPGICWEVHCPMTPSTIRNKRVKKQEAESHGHPLRVAFGFWSGTSRAWPSGRRSSWFRRSASSARSSTWSAIRRSCRRSATRPCASSAAFSSRWRSASCFGLGVVALLDRRNAPAADHGRHQGGRPVASFIILVLLGSRAATCRSSSRC